MSIDPRLMTQLLRLQFQANDPLSPRNSAASDTGDFSALLETFLDEQMMNAGKREAAPVTWSSGLPASTLPASLYAVTGPVRNQPRPPIGPAKPNVYDPLVNEASARHGIEPELVKAVIQSESSFNPYAVSSAGAKGLMQLMDETGASVGVKNPFDPAQNIEGGTRYLAGLLRKYDGNEAVALAAYNAGPGRVDRLGIRTDAALEDKLHLLPAETQRYVRKVLDRKQQYGE
ncbi:lytic transglycosylase domain-containing protein [Paenibacillus hodogayensis]|uniref:Lytic transglycosylase domain-containing protein n=1 Tax=Paenibacillus hodogayensis TaxID=279208 RepID=A0ABV5VQH0_9BACL